MRLSLPFRFVCLWLQNLTIKARLEALPLLLSVIMGAPLEHDTERSLIALVLNIVGNPGESGGHGDVVVSSSCRLCFASFISSWTANRVF